MSPQLHQCSGPRLRALLLSIILGITACGGGGGGAGTGGGEAASAGQSPLITAQPPPQTAATAGAAVTLSVQATGPGLTYQWQRDGQDIPGASGASYTLNEVQPADAASKFSAEVRNAYGTVHSTVTQLQVPVPKGLALLAGRTGGPGNLDGKDARFYVSSAMAVSPSGMLLMVDAPGSRGRLRSIDPATGETTTLMTYEENTVPYAMAFDTAGNRYEMTRWAVYKTTPAGVRKRLAGGVSAEGRIVDGIGTDARFASLFDMTIDGAGNLYVIDARRLIRKIDAVGRVTTLAGIRNGSPSVDGDRGTAVFSDAVRLAADGAGNVYVVEGDDYSNPRPLRKVTPDGTVTTIPLREADGSGPVLRLGAGGGGGALVVDPNGNLYVTTNGACRIRKIAADGSVTTLAGPVNDLGRVYDFGSTDGKGDAARFCSLSTFNMERFASDKAGNLYVHDVANFTVRRITPAGEVTTVAGRAGARPAGATGEDGNGRAADFRVIQQYDANLAAAYPLGVYTLAVDPKGDVYFGDGGSMRKITPGGAVSRAGRPGYVGALAYGGKTLEIEDGLINLFDALDARPVLIGKSAKPDEAAVDGPRDVATFHWVRSPVMDGLGNIYLHDRFGGDVNRIQRKIGPDGFVTTLPPGPADASPIAVWHADRNGVVWAATSDGAILRIDQSGKRTTVRGATQRSPTAITRDAAGNLYLATAESANPVDERGTWCLVRKIAPDGTETVVAGTEGSLGVRLGGQGSLGWVVAMATGPDGILYLMSENALLTLRP